MRQQVEFYPSSASCIQGCHHCPRSISTLSQIQHITDVSDAQREIVRRVLLLGASSGNTLNLSNHIGEYGFELFDDVKDFGITALGFNAGILDKNVIGTLDENLDRMNIILPTNSGDRNLQIVGNLRYMSGNPETFPSEDFTKFLTQYFTFFREGKSSISDARLCQVVLSANNIPARHSSHANSLNLAHKIFQSHSEGFDDYLFSDTSLTSIPEEGFFMAKSKLVLDGDFNTDVIMRGLSAKAANKHDLSRAIEDAAKGEFVVSVFPDSVMVYHSALNIHIPELFFSYDEFFDMLQEASKKSLFIKKRELRQIVDLRLQERLQKQMSDK